MRPNPRPGAAQAVPGATCRYTPHLCRAGPRAGAAPPFRGPALQCCLSPIPCRPETVPQAPRLREKSGPGSGRAPHDLALSAGLPGAGPPPGSRDPRANRALLEGGRKGAFTPLLLSCRGETRDELALNNRRQLRSHTLRAHGGNCWEHNNGNLSASQTGGGGEGSQTSRGRPDPRGRAVPGAAGSGSRRRGRRAGCLPGKRRAYGAARCQNTVTHRHCQQTARKHLPFYARCPSVKRLRERRRKDRKGKEEKETEESRDREAAANPRVERLPAAAAAACVCVCVRARRGSAALLAMHRLLHRSTVILGISRTTETWRAQQ
ncbi:uncharacterized protein LOC115604273 [Strigops habroptila]|uniref:uncharacterized protein LOC115604273 n=1 Tax=Strigops habroptila TaxID=2489341 RepID=UPI0011CFF175|nr:uncharacterized protein LOC115604273 [Strigops habroptila]